MLVMASRHQAAWMDHLDSALQPRLYLKLHLGGLKADPGGEGTEKGIFLPHSEQGIHRSAVQQLEVGGTGHINARSPADDGVKAFSRKGMQGVFLATTGLDPLHNLVALLPQAVHLPPLLWRVLQITVHD